MSSYLYFYPRPPRGGRHRSCSVQTLTACISIHALREEGDPRIYRRQRASGPISIHALREEGDVLITHLARRQLYFYPRPPRGGRPVFRVWLTITKKFLSTPSARRATMMLFGSVRAILFLSTPSARRATAKTETKSLFSYKLYNILHGFRRALIYNGSKNYPNHAK